MQSLTFDQSIRQGVNTRNLNSFKNKTIFVKKIGEGMQAIVEQHTLKEDSDLGNKGDLVAVKKYFTNNEGDLDPATLRELNIFQKLKNCPTINQMLDINMIIKSSIQLHIMMPFHQYNLLQLSDNTIISFADKIKQLPSIMEQLFNALYNLYYLGVIHTDIKPDNILVDIIDNQFKLSLADFGLAIQLPCEFAYRHIKLPIYGSPLYLAPEVLTFNYYYNEKVDIWSTGITLLDFITGEYTTEPTREQMNLADDDGMVAIIYKLFDMIKQPLYPTYQLYEQVKRGSLHDYIDVDLLLTITLDKDYDLIPEETIRILQSMLQINPTDRVHITDLYNGNLCSVTTIIERGPLLVGNVDDYFAIVYQLISLCNRLDISPVTCYLAIDLFERYIANYQINNLSKYAATALILSHKLYESVEKMVEYKEMMQTFNVSYNELLFTQLQMLKNFNYLLTTCETDELVHTINTETDKTLKIFNFASALRYVQLSGNQLEEFKLSTVNRKEIYPRLYNMYKQIQADGLYPGELFNFDLVDYFLK